MKIKKRMPSAIHFRFRYLIALICAVTFVIILFFFLKPFNNLAKIYNNRQLEYLIVELTTWQDEGFQAIVVDEGNNDTFLVGNELTIVFESETDIVLEDGTRFNYDSNNPQAGAVGWAPGTKIQIEYQKYEKSKSHSRIYAYHAESIS